MSHKADVQITDDRGRNLFVILMLAVNSFPFEHVRSTLIASGINIQKNSETHVKKLMKLLYTLAESEIEPQDIIQEKLKYMAFLLEQGFTLDALSEAEKGCLLKLSETYKIANLDQLSKLQVHA